MSIARALPALLAAFLAARPAPAVARFEDDPLEVSLQELTSVDYKRGEKLPDEIAKLDGKKVTIEGYMALGTIEGVEKFELVPEPCECGRSKVQHFVDVTMEKGTTSYRPGRIQLVGTLEVGEVEEDGFVVSVYRLRIESID